MTTKPILFFTPPKDFARAKRSSVPPTLRPPGWRKQRTRLAPKFSALGDILRKKTAGLSTTVEGLEPEQVLVLETIGTAQNFLTAVRGIPELEWLAEIDEYETQPDTDFFDPANPDRTLSGHIYLAMANSTALSQLQTLFDQYTKDENVKFPHGQGAWKEIFRYLRQIRPWGVKDRLRETNIIENWQFRVQYEPTQPVPVEIELWFKSNPQHRVAAQSHVEHIITEYGGRVIAASDIADIRYHAILAELPINGVDNLRKIRNSGLVELIKCDQVMFFRPVGQCLIKVPEGEEASDATLRDLSLEVTDSPIIAVLDGVPLTGHPLLNRHIILDDPDNFSAAYEAQDRQHGTSICSLIIHDDLSTASTAINRKVYVRPILKPFRDGVGNMSECVPQDQLVTDLLYRSLIRIFEGSAEEAPVAPDIKVINLSVGDSARPFLSSISPLARLIDWASWKYSVLFCISAGNHGSHIELDMSVRNFENLSADEKQKKIVQAIYADTRNRRALSPAEAINAISVGALHSDSSQVRTGDLRVNPYASMMLPSPISAHGHGFRRSIKPEVCMSGGRQFYTAVPRNNKVHLEISNHSSAPGHKVASPRVTVLNSNPTTFCRGTSNATALATRTVSIFYEAIQQWRNDGLDLGQIHEKHIPAILKAMLCHASNWGEAYSAIESAFNGRDRSTIRKIAARLLGYGSPTSSRVTACSDERVTLVGLGEIKVDQAQRFELPLPPSLAGKPIWRKLLVTLAWISPVNPLNAKYRVAALSFNPPFEELQIARQGADDRAVKRGTVQHEVLEGSSSVAFVDGEKLVIEVDCLEDGGKLKKTTVPYCIMVSLEVSESVGIQVYNEVKTRIAVPVPVENT